MDEADEVWIVFAVRGGIIVDPMVFNRKRLAEEHRRFLLDKMRLEMKLALARGRDWTQDPGWSVHMALAGKGEEDD